MRLGIPFAKALINNYKQNHWTILNGSCPALHQNPSFPNVQDSRSVWFSLNDLKAFICDFEKSASQDMLGVRIYFGEYSADLINTQQLSNSMENSQYIGLHTLLMVPTVLRNDGLNHDFDPQSGNSNFSQANDMCAMNHGTLMPPPYQVNNAVQSINVGQDFMIFCDTNP